jgi:hypothetical protein
LAQLLRLIATVMLLACVSFTGCAISYAEPFEPADYALGISPEECVCVRYLDHVVVKIDNIQKSPEYFLIYSYVKLFSRGSYPLTSSGIVSQVFKIDFKTEKFIELRDDIRIGEVLSTSSLVDYEELNDYRPVQTAGPPPDYFEKYKCNFLGKRFREEQHPGSWYFLRMSTNSMFSDPVDTFGCASLEGRAEAWSQIAMLGPRTYELSGKSFIVDFGFPIAIWIQKSEQKCLIQKLHKDMSHRDHNEQKTLYIFDNRPLPAIFGSKLGTAQDVRKFQFWFANKFDAIWASLVTNRNCIEVDNEAFWFAHLAFDNGRRYINFEDEHQGVVGTNK